MSLLPVWEEIEKLSPDPATLERCYRLASKRYLKDIGFCEPFIWGKIKTSGASFYQVCWQLDTLISASNSPIYTKPDKYALALAFYFPNKRAPHLSETSQFAERRSNLSHAMQPKATQLR
jgi:hypothetical protein